ncbi:MAG: hypothetical protein ACT4P2_00210 [Pseudomonadota bacterium]
MINNIESAHRPDRRPKSWTGGRARLRRSAAAHDRALRLGDGDALAERRRLGRNHALSSGGGVRVKRLGLP